MLFPSHFPRPTTQIVPNLQWKEESATQYSTTHIIHTQKKNLFTYYILIDFLHYKITTTSNEKKIKKSTDNNAVYTVLVIANLRMFVNVSNTTHLDILSQQQKKIKRLLTY